MRLTLPRWLAVAFLAGGLTALLAVPDPREPAYSRFYNSRGQGVPLPPDLWSSINHQVVLTQSLRASLSLERARTALAAVRSGAPAIDVRFEATTPSEVKRQATAEQNLRLHADSMRHLRERMRAGSRGDVQVALKVLAATDIIETTTAPASFRAWVVLPPALDGTGCVVVVQRWFTEHNLGYGLYRNIFGPCFWYGAFGKPGHGMQEWLAATKHAGSGWTGRENFGYFGFGFPSPRPPQFVFELEAMRYTLGADNLALKCVAEGGDACTQVIGAEFRFSSRARVPAGGKVVQLDNTYRYLWSGSLGAIYSEFGPERFARLWRSDKPFPEAFADATGERLEEYTRRALSRDVGGAYHAGPWLPAGATLVELVIGAAMLAVTAFAGRRPTVA